MSRYNPSADDENLAYGDYNQAQPADGERGFIGDVGKRLFGKHQDPQSKPSGGGMSFIFDKLHDAVHDIGAEVKEKLSGQSKPEQGHQQQQQETPYGQQSVAGPSSTTVDQNNNNNRFKSFAPERTGNDVKWYVDGCGYMWAVSRALEQARESIWILDWWLSPELYLRRPPAKNQQYRVDRMLQAAAERGVKVNIIVYKEVTQALTLSSSHTKHHLEDLHQNIAVFRHPDHLPDGQVVASNILDTIKNLNAATASKLPGDSLKAIYGVHEDTVLYWAHHEKLCLVDGRIAFMGGLDLCYGRWDTNQHSIADAHPGDLDRIVFPGQDYNNARIMDFDDVVHWENNKLDRTKSSRMGWSDISLCLTGPVVQDLQTHFTQRWNFIYDEKYNTRKDSRYVRLPERPSFAPPPSQGYRGLDEGQEGEPAYGERERGFDGEEGGDGERGLFGRGGHGGFRERIKHHMPEGFPGGQHEGGYQQSQHHPQHQQQHHAGGAHNGASCQITRSSAKWSHGATLEHSIQNAYCEVIRNSEHFVYIENQFFITATGGQQKPVKNQIGAAIVERILRAARNGEKYMMIVMMPAVPAFAGDLRTDEALGTRAIMEFQYNSINRGGNSIYELIAREGYNPLDYIRFYNLRNYDRINVSGVMSEVEHQTGVSYEDARKEHDTAYGGVYANEPPPPPQYQAYHPPPPESSGYGNQGQGYGQHGGYVPYNQQPVYEMDASSRGIGEDSAYQQYQRGAHQVGDRKGLGSGKWDSVASCYMLGGEDIRNVPWEGGAMDEMDAFVSEELYVHSKLLIADDRIVICGSANLNDRSQNGDHDSEIAIIINDPTPVESRMNGRSWRASKFATSLRRQIFRKHLGLIPAQDYERPDQNFEPIGAPNVYDWGSREDELVADPLSDEFLHHWFRQAKTNTDAFARVFHPVPHDGVRTWKDYDDYYSRFFKEEGKGDDKKPSKYKWGHVVAEDFRDVREVKEVLSQIKGTLVEMPLLFLKDEDMAKEGLSLNAFTEELYT